MFRLNHMIGRSRPLIVQWTAAVVVDRAVVHGPRVHGAPVIHAKGYVIWAIDLRSGGPGGLQAQKRRHKADLRWRRAGSSPEHRRRRRLGATGYHLRNGLDREQEGDSAKLTSCSMTAMGRCRRRAVMRGGRDHGRPSGRWLRPRLCAFEGRDGVL
jgi:hypothetical protein